MSGATVNPTATPDPFTWRFPILDAAPAGAVQSANDPNEFLKSANTEEFLETANE